jgi:hypothetical protein
MNSQLSTSHQKTYDHIFQHPLPHNLQWREVVSMLSAMPDTNATEDPDGKLKITRNGQSLTLHRPRTKDLTDTEELMQLRHFLDRSAAPAPTPAKPGTHLLVVIDHHQARIFTTELHNSLPHRITPYDPFGFGRALHYNQDDSNGQRKPEQKSFYESIAKTLQNATQILLFGTATGSSSAMEQLLADLKKNHPDIAAKITHSLTIDEHHLTEDQLLAKARDLFTLA